MSAKRNIAIVIIVSFFFTWVVPVSLAAEAGDKFIKLFQEEIRPPDDLLPQGVKVAKGFKPGVAIDVGEVKKIKGHVLVVHAQSSDAYRIKKGYDVHTGDMLITGEESTIQIKLKDKSMISLASYSKLVIDSSVYDPKKKTRSSFMRMLFGKARFVVSKLVQGRADDFKIKTPTAVCGVRGSDFALAVAPADDLSFHKKNWFSYLKFVGTAHAQATGGALATTVVTGKETSVNFTGDVGPTQVVGPLQTSRATAGMPASVPVTVSAGAVEKALEAATGSAAGMSTAALVGIGVLTAGAVGAGAYYGAEELKKEEKKDDFGGGDLPGGTGEVKATLQWSDCNDLDLEMQPPTSCSNSKIYHGNRQVTCDGHTGQLDLDANVPFDENCTTQDPVENIYWTSAPSGYYTVRVVYFEGSGSSDYTLTIIVDGVRTTYNRTLVEGGSDPYSFTKE
jgi:hypothetical protein